MLGLTGLDDVITPDVRQSRHGSWVHHGEVVFDAR
jgi:hypothetical protein